MNEFSKWLIVAGMAMILAGVAIAVFGKIPGLGRLPGDIYIRKEKIVFYFPLASCLLISLVLTVLFSILGRK